jgi:hypothetical protein
MDLGTEGKPRPTTGLPVVFAQSMRSGWNVYCLFKIFVGRIIWPAWRRGAGPYARP